MGYAFISYSTKNQFHADALRALLDKNGIPTWMAPYDIPIGNHYAQVINGAIKGCSCLVLLLTNDSQNSVWVPKEVERALHYHKPILPIQLGDVILNDEFEMYISTDQIVPVCLIEETNSKIKQIVAAISVYVEQKTPESPIAQVPVSDSFDLLSLRTFASCGKENSVFKVRPTEDGVLLEVNFEPTRLRNEIPDFAGAYCLKQPALDIRSKNTIRFRCRATGISHLTVELKPVGKNWMHESFPFLLSDRWQEYCISTAAFVYPKTLSCLEEITFTLRGEDFQDIEQLRGTLELADLILE